jgi:hypothetical protein
LRVQARERIAEYALSLEAIAALLTEFEKRLDREAMGRTEKKQ